MFYAGLMWVSINKISLLMDLVYDYLHKDEGTIPFIITNSLKHAF